MKLFKINDYWVLTTCHVCSLMLCSFSDSALTTVQEVDVITPCTWWMRKSRRRALKKHTQGPTVSEPHGHSVHVQTSTLKPQSHMASWKLQPKMELFKSMWKTMNSGCQALAWAAPHKSRSSLQLCLFFSQVGLHKDCWGERTGKNLTVLGF